jgi:hypothetical protein
MELAKRHATINSEIGINHLIYQAEGIKCDVTMNSETGKCDGMLNMEET